MDKIEQLIRIGVSNGQFPQFVYKYRVSDPVKNDKFENIITDNSLWFSKPSGFNDPFDCQLTPIVDFSDYEIDCFLDRLPIDAVERVKVKNTILADPDNFREILIKHINFESKGVLSLSKEPDNIILWSHYADNHEGVCLKFDILKSIDFFSIPLNVTYDESYPQYNHMTEPNKIAEKLIKIKYKKWDYEKEIRVFKNSPGLKKFEKESLVEVIFGARMQNDEKNRIISIFKNTPGYNHVKFMSCSISKTKYGLDISEY